MSAQKPKDAQLFEEMLESMGVKEHEPRVILQLLDFMYRYVAEVLQDADAYSERCSKRKGELTREDILLAIQAREGLGEAWHPDAFAPVAFTQPPAQNVLNELAARRNKQKLPALGKKAGLRLPPDADCLLAPNYQLQPKSVAAASTTPVSVAQRPQTEADAGHSAAPPAQPTAVPYSLLREHHDDENHVVQQEIDWQSQPVHFQDCNQVCLLAINPDQVRFGRSLLVSRGLCSSSSVADLSPEQPQTQKLVLLEQLRLRWACWQMLWSCIQSTR
ncbi:hypothetical protein WJX72_004340 [[Myrmecia] bisecta]|uniref:Transcription initiation factor TFIID subunit 9 n=1 Tax=[Myrmecia] bisecta TaxID=41462 RepID=A0AAW1QQ44_9CHLO